MMLKVVVILLGILVVFEWFYTLNVEQHRHSDRIDRTRDDIHELQDYHWRDDDRIDSLNRELKYNRNRGDRLEHEMEELREALHMQGIATEVKTEEVKVLVKPEDTDGEDTDN